MEQRPELVSAQRQDLHANQMTVAVEHRQARRGSAPGSHGADEEHRPRHDQRNEHGHRCVVEQVEVVDEQDESVVAGEPPQLGSGGVEEPGALVVTDAELGGQISRQQMSQRAERDLLGGRMADGALDGTAAALGESQRLLGKTRLADPGGAVQHDAGDVGVAVVAAEFFELS